MGTVTPISAQHLDRAPEGLTRFTPRPISALSIAFTEDGALRRPFRLLAGPMALTAAVAAAVAARRVAPSYQVPPVPHL